MGNSLKDHFSVIVADMDEFMGSPVLGAIAEGAVIATKAAADIATDDDVVFLWDQITGDDEEEEVKEEEVQIEFVYRNSKSVDQIEQSDNLTIYIIALCVLIALILVFIVGICFYNRYVMKF